VPDPIRVVPLHPGLQAPPPAPAPSAQLTYRGGPLLTAVEVTTIFWGAAWAQADAALAAQVNGFFDTILTSPAIDQLAEYNVPAYSIGHGKRVASATVSMARAQAQLTDGGVQRFIQAQLKANKSLPQPGPNSLYFVYLAPGVTVSQGGGRSCTTFCGYHNDIGGNLFYAVMPYPGCPGCVGGLSVFNALTSTSSHELCEAITDAIPGQGWYDDANGEIGDICAWKTKQVAGYTVQLEWSNRAGACV
jgi:hypothetical protein